MARFKLATVLEDDENILQEGLKLLHTTDVIPPLIGLEWLDPFLQALWQVSLQRSADLPHDTLIKTADMWLNAVGAACVASEASCSAVCRQVRNSAHVLHYFMTGLHIDDCKKALQSIGVCYRVSDLQPLQEDMSCMEAMRQHQGEMVLFSLIDLP